MSNQCNQCNQFGFPIVAHFGYEPATEDDLLEVDSYKQQFGIPSTVDIPKLDLDSSLPWPDRGDLSVADFIESCAQEIVPQKESLIQFADWWTQNADSATAVVGSVQWGNISGWQRADLATGKLTIVEHPTEDIFVIDTETFYQADNMAIIATAVSTKGLYLWLHPSYVNPSLPYVTHYVPVGSGKVIIGHNIGGFDASRLLECVQWGSPANHIIDTMSLHIVTSGVTSAQRWWYQDPNPRYVPSWASHGCGNSLVSCYEYYTFRERDDFAIEGESAESTKNLRSIFMKADSMETIVAAGEVLLTYAINDTLRTAELFGHLWPRYLESAPSWATVVGHSAIANSVVPLAPDWDSWVAHCDEMWTQELIEIDSALSKLALELLEEYLSGELDENTIQADPWLAQMDWTTSWKVTKSGKPSSKSWGIPEWYKKLLPSGWTNSADIKLSLKAQVAPLLMRVSYQGQPVLFNRSLGWCTRNVDSGKLTRVEHPLGDSKNVGSLFSQDLDQMWESGELSSDHPRAIELLNRAAAIAYWTSTRKRVSEVHYREVTL